MIELFLLYWFAQANKIVAFFAVAGIITACLFVVVSLIWGIERPHDADAIKKWDAAWTPWIQRVAVVGVISLFLGVLVPDRTGLAIIVGGKIAFDVAKSPAVQEISDELRKAILSQLRGLQSSAGKKESK